MWKISFGQFIVKYESQKRHEKIIYTLTSVDHFYTFGTFHNWIIFPIIDRRFSFLLPSSNWSLFLNIILRLFTHFLLKITLKLFVPLKKWKLFNIFDCKNRIFIAHIVVMGPGQTFLTRVGSIFCCLGLVGSAIFRSGLGLKNFS